MTENKYAFQGFEKDHMARVIGKDLSISTKVAIEISSYLRNKKLSRAKDALTNVLKFKEAIPYNRFTDGVGHRPGKLAGGRYPQKASKAILDLLESVEANAQVKGLNTSNLVIIHICAHRAHQPMHQGRQRRRSFKRSHVEVIVKEGEKKENKQAKKQDKKQDDKSSKPVEKNQSVENKLITKETPKEVSKDIKKEVPKESIPKPVTKSESKPVAEKPAKLKDEAGSADVKSEEKEEPKKETALADEAKK